MPIVDKILGLGKKYINPSMNIYNRNYCLIIKNLFDCIYNTLSYFKSFLTKELFKNINLYIFKTYRKYYQELIELCPSLDEKSKA